MRKLSICICLVGSLYFSNKLSAQTVDTASYDRVIFSKAEVDPSLPGGLKAWQRYLERTLNPKLAFDNGAPSGSYRVVVQFIVDKEGAVSSVKPLTTHGYGMEEEFMRVIKNVPKWVPATQNGHKVKCYFMLPMTFIVP
jgi:periplasmic protein TonB